jgi:hypothetical protein
MALNEKYRISYLLSNLCFCMQAGKNCRIIEFDSQMPRSNLSYANHHSDPSHLSWNNGEKHFIINHRRPKRLLEKVLVVPMIHKSHIKYGTFLFVLGDFPLDSRSIVVSGLAPVRLWQDLLGGQFLDSFV